MFSSYLSPITLYGGFLRRTLSAAGLVSRTVDIGGDTTIHFWGPNQSSTKSSSSSPRKPALVLIHGFGPHGVWQWMPQISAFGRDYDLYVPSLVFFGRSTTKSSGRSELFQAQCLGRLLVEKLGLGKFSVVGTSYGGFVAYHVARTWPEAVEKVVIASSAVNMVEEDQDEIVRRAKVEKIEDLMVPSTARELRTLLSLCVFRRFHRFLPDFVFTDLIQKLYSQNRKEKHELLKGLSQLGKDGTVNISPLQQEVLIIWGEHDQIFPLVKATKLKEVMGKEARLEVIKSASHIPQLEQGSQFNKLVKHFLIST